MDRIPCINSLAADREYFKPDAGDAYEAFCMSLTDADLYDEAAELAEELHGEEAGEWSDEQFKQFAWDNADVIADRLWERA